MKCPHCLVEIHSETTTMPVGQDNDGKWGAVQQVCPACSKIIIFIVCGSAFINTAKHIDITDVKKTILAYPRSATRPAPPSDVPKEFAEDYIEASLVLADSPKASAALSRRCLQHILRDKAGVKPSDLAKEIDQVISSGALPSHLAEAIDAIRNIGNFAAHPIKSTTTGEIVPVEPGEAEWNLDVLDGLFDFYFVQPAFLKKRREALNAKLAESGKPPVK